MTKKITKICSLLLAISLVFTLVACNKNKDKIDDGGKKEQTVYLTYAEWGDAALAQEMIDAFEVKYPNIKVTLDTTITGTGAAFTQNLVAAAQAGILPDVFVTDNVPTVIANNLVYDIAEMWNKDADAQLVYDNIAATAVYGEKRLAAPSYQFIKGFFVNRTLLRNLGISVPEYDWTFEEFYDICLKVQQAGEYGGYPIHAINGYYGVVDFEKVMPAQDSSNVFYDVWNGTKFNYEDPLWIKYRKITEVFYDTKLLEQLTEEEKTTIYGNASAWPFEKGHAAFAVEGSWNVISMLKQFQAGGMDVEFYPYPAGKEQKEAVILDYMCVSSLTAYPEEAFELLKWMSFGRDGWTKRLEIMKSKGTGLDRYPVANYPEIWENINTYMEELDETNNYTGLTYCISILDKAVPDCDKWMPGYSDFWNWVSETEETEGWYDKDTDQLAREWSAKLNEFVNAAYDSLGLSR